MPYNNMSPWGVHISYSRQSEVRYENGFKFPPVSASESYVVYSGCCVNCRGFVGKNEKSNMSCPVLILLPACVKNNQAKPVFRPSTQHIRVRTPPDNFCIPTAVSLLCPRQLDMKEMRLPAARSVDDVGTRDVHVEYNITKMITR
jgi:hypothetical protein